MTTPNQAFSKDMERLSIFTSVHLRYTGTEEEGRRIYDEADKCFRLSHHPNKC
jgi:hypothetical protein